MKSVVPAESLALDTLEACETVIAGVQATFIRIGRALETVRDQRFYKQAGYPTFEAYCKVRWEMSRPQAYRLIDAAVLHRALPAPSPIGDGGRPAEWNEAQLRELKRLGSPTRAKAVAGRVLDEVKANGGKLTAAVIRRHVDQALGTDRRPKPKELPEFKQIIYGWAGELRGMARLIDDATAEQLAYFGETEPKLTREFQAAVEKLLDLWRATRPPE